ncbi:hypothetical protein CK203_044585 [Vitis vinifera]|uniref:Retrotransposon gag domain-containing protein n=1 Tax=Vitis vinifera TaxID=29760 RepID=A0A438HJX0_VITVI|nr:hypothetical protein CK203_044585 [Vitis vinifera]
MEATPEDQHSHHGHQDNPNAFRSEGPHASTLSIRTWTDLKAEFLKKCFPTYRTNGLKRQISNFLAKENEKFYECWERYMEAINACPHHGFDTWLLVSYFYDGMSSSMKQLLETMCGGDFMREVRKTKSQPNAFNAKAGMYTLNEDIDMKAKFAAMTRRLEELELKKIHKVQVVAETPVQIKQMSLDNSSPTMLRMEILTTQVGGTSKFSWKPRAPQYTQPAQPSQQASSLEQAIVNLSKKIDNLQYSISRLTNLNTLQEKGRFPSQPHQNPKGIHEVETHGRRVFSGKRCQSLDHSKEW